MVVFAIVAGMGMAAGGVLSHSLPRDYYSRVIMEVKADSSGPLRLDETSGGLPHPPASQFQVIQSKEILYPVIDDLKLVETWSSQEGGHLLPKEEAYSRLLGQLKLSQIRNTDLMEIGVFSTDRTEAANIANAIALVFQKVQSEDQRKVHDATLAQLRKEVDALRKTAVTAAPEDADKAKSALEAAERRLSTQTVELKMTVVPAKIWEKAEPAVYPAKPYVGRIMALATAAGVVLGFVAAGLFLRSSRRD